MYTQRVLLRTSGLRALAVGGSLSCVFAVFDEARRDTSLSSVPAQEPLASKGMGLPHFNIAPLTWDNIRCLFEPNKAHLEAAPSKPVETINEVQHQQQPVKEAIQTTETYDFVVIGNGNAGQSAVQTLQERCPRARIAVVDPWRPAAKQGRTKHFKASSTGFNPRNRTVELSTKDNVQLQYKHGILIATGSRGAPPPLELFEESSLSRVLELKTTELAGNKKRPMMAPEHVRNTVVEAARSGGKVAVLGSGWEALDLACAVNNAGRTKPTIMFGHPGPAWNILPTYLSAELRKKMTKRGITILNRSVVRYVADVDRAGTKKVELHTARTYDLLETKRSALDLMVVAPDSFGTKGTASLPTTEIPDRMKETSDGRPWYKTWSQLTKSSAQEPSVVVCFEDDGRVAVNTQLCAASRVFAAGSVAKYPNSATGQASIAGEGCMDGSEAGRVAAVNMSLQYLENSSPFSSQTDYSSDSFASCSLPIWRSDIASYQGKGGPIQTSLSSMGVQAMCIGNCDSERLDTRGFWWTNTSAQRKVRRMIEAEEEELARDSESVGGMSRSRMMQRRKTRRRRKLGLVTPIYGIGVVFYLDRTGRIRGIMTWGLPFAKEAGGTINPHLLSAIQKAIVTNAGVSPLVSEENHQVMNNAMAKQSQRFVSLAVRGHFADTTVTSHGLDGEIEGFATPLYRFTEVDKTEKANTKVLKRKEGRGLGVLGEDLYARDEFAIEQSDMHDTTEEKPSNIPVTSYPIAEAQHRFDDGSSKKSISADSLAELNRYLAVQRGWEDNENRARPGKEDPLWLRPGDERRNISRKQIMVDAFRTLMFPHKTQ